MSRPDTPARKVTREMLTPALLREHVWFEPTRLRRGYDEEDVDHVLDLLADYLEDLLVENNRLRMRQGEDRYVEYGYVRPTDIPGERTDP